MQSYAQRRPSPWTTCCSTVKCLPASLYCAVMHACTLCGMLMCSTITERDTTERTVPPPCMLQYMCSNQHLPNAMQHAQQCLMVRLANIYPLHSPPSPPHPSSGPFLPLPPPPPFPPPPFPSSPLLWARPIHCHHHHDLILAPLIITAIVTPQHRTPSLK